MREQSMTTLTTAPAGTEVLSDDMLLRFAQRAPGYDRENRFFQEDFDELRAAGYLKLGVPKDLGGAGCSLAEIAAQQRRLAYRAPATALAINMHIYWTGVAADLRRMGDNSLEWLLREAAAGEVFAAGHGETGNDLPLLLSSSKAERTDGGYRFTGHKMFGSLSPVWTRLGLHGMDTSDPAAPKVIHAFMPRSTPVRRLREKPSRSCGGALTDGAARMLCGLVIRNPGLELRAPHYDTGTRRWQRAELRRPILGVE